jgi:hypothetical protein
MKNIERKLRDFGESMVSVTWAASAALSTVLTGISAVIIAIFNAPTIELGNFFRIIGLLVLYGVGALIAFGILTVIIKSVSFGFGHILLWAFSKELYGAALITFDVKPFNRWAYTLVVNNAERWLPLENAKIIWADFAMTIDSPVTREMVDNFNTWTREKKSLEWHTSDVKKQDVVNIKKGKSKQAYVFELDDKKDNVGLLGINSDPIYLPKGEYTFHLIAQGDMLEKIVNIRVHIDVSFDDNLMIKRVWSTLNY